jgi:hypothetical protein
MNRLRRQSFLGAESDAILAASTVGFVGLGGGGSHAVQQAAHLGIGGFVLIDPDSIDETNTNRLVGGTQADVLCGELKVNIAERLIRGVNPGARIKKVNDGWETALDDLKGCDVVFGAVDSYLCRDGLERFCRRFMIPYIDVGMDVYPLPSSGGYLVSGQVIVSSPGEPCMRCCHFLTEERLKEEAGRYGEAGERPQVVWSNGVLASTAIGILVQTLTPWFPSREAFVYLVYDGNRGTVQISPHVSSLRGKVCSHFPNHEVGAPTYDVRKSPGTPTSNESPILSPQPGWWRRFASWLRFGNGKS